MKKYSKEKLKFRRFTTLLTVLLLAMLIIGLVLLFCFCLKDKFEISNQVNNAVSVPDEVAQNSEPIVIDNLIVGALYNNSWVSATKYLKSTKKTDLDTNVYTKTTKAGEYKIKDTYSFGDSLFVNTSYPNYIDEYFSIPGDTYALSSQFNEVEIKEEDYKSVKKALGINRIYNSSMNIKSVYSGFIDSSIPIRIISVTSSKKGMFGGIYSAIIIDFVDGNKSRILQYSYTKDLENSYDFPLYSVEFLADLNGDGMSEIVTREVTEFNVTYNIFEYKKGKFVKVLCETMKGKA